MPKSSTIKQRDIFNCFLTFIVPHESLFHNKWIPDFVIVDEMMKNNDISSDIKDKLSFVSFNRAVTSCCCFNNERSQLSDSFILGRNTISEYKIK